MSSRRLRQQSPLLCGRQQSRVVFRALPIEEALWFKELQRLNGRGR